MSKVTYDFHSHILPSVDDGAKSVEDSITLIESLVSQGVTDICLTPHYYTSNISTEDFLSKRDEAFDLLKNNLPENIKVNFHLGAEVYITKYLFSNPIDKRICIDGTDYILCEFNYDKKFRENMIESIENLIYSNSLIPIIAHIERYGWLLKDEKARKELLSMGVLFQTNAISLCDRKFKKKLLKMIANNEISFLGTDAHSMHRNSPLYFSQAQVVISDKLSSGNLDFIQTTSKNIFS